MPSVLVGHDHERQRFLELRRARIVLEGVLRAVDRGHVRAALDVVGGDVVLVLRETVAQEHHALSRVGHVLAIWKAPNELLKRRERSQSVFRRAQARDRRLNSFSSTFGA